MDTDNKDELFDETLSDKELIAYLAEIEREDDELEETSEITHEAIAEMDALADVAEAKEDGYSATIADRAARESKIKRFAFSQSKLQLSTRIPEKHFKLLISLLTEPHKKIVNEYRQYINNRLARVLLKEMPAPIRRCWKQYNWSIKRSVGFLYVAQPEGAKREYEFYATPSIPAFFEQHSERAILMEHNPTAVTAIDKAVKTLHEHQRRKSQREVAFATSLINNNIKTYFDLVKAKPLMFELLYNHLYGTPDIKA